MSQPRERDFAQVDVFSHTPYLGNPVAVVLDAEGLTEDAMATFARWTNLSETTFVLPSTTPDSDYRLRIFTPGGELPFAGHPTLGSAHAWLESGRAPRNAGVIVQECAAGLIDIRTTPTGLAFAAPPTVRNGDLDDALLSRIATALHIGRNSIISHQWVDNGPGWAAIRLATADEVLALEPDLTEIPDLMLGVVGASGTAGQDFEVRAFAPAIGVSEDPVTGSLNASIAQWLIRTDQAPTTYTAAQGRRVGRSGVIEISSGANGELWVGGPSTSCIRGTVRL
jgi:PhzF family phenazine biosynthesis protein